MTALEKVREIENILMLTGYSCQAIEVGWGDDPSMDDNIHAMFELVAEGALQEILRVIYRKPGE